MGYHTKFLERMLADLGVVTDESGRLTRTFLSPAMRRANKLVGSWMREAGLTVREDAVGNLIGRLGCGNPKARTLLLGSHLDTVRDAGIYDGPLGVLLPIVVLADLASRGVRLPFHVEVIGFSEEEGVRFAGAYLGSKGYCGRLTERDLALRDAKAISVQEAISAWHRASEEIPNPVGSDTFPLRPAHTRRELLGYVEVHIEQGPVLEKENLAVGVVTAIAGQSRFKLTWTGKAGHAGTTPMALRRDALAGAAEFAVGVEAIARRTPGLVVTIGSLTVSPGAANVIPARVEHTLDVRHARDADRRQALQQIGRLATQVARRRKLQRTWLKTQEDGATLCSPALTARLARSVKAVQGSSATLVSGAGHDGVIVSALAPIAMLFVRCREGLSHHPDEYAAPADLAVARKVLTDFLETLAREPA